MPVSGTRFQVSGIAWFGTISMEVSPGLAQQFQYDFILKGDGAPHYLAMFRRLDFVKQGIHRYPRDGSTGKGGNIKNLMPIKAMEL